MKIKLFLLVFFVLPFFVFSQGKVYKDTLIVRDSYTVLYSQLKGQPLMITYTVLNKPSITDRRTLDFHEVEGVVTSFDGDYSYNEWDKGHMAPASTFGYNWNYMNQTFEYINIALQHQSLNRGVWKSLESRERVLSKSNPVHVTITLEFNDPNLKSEYGCLIPTAFYKILRYGLKYEVYYFPNKYTTGWLSAYKIK